MLFTWHCGFVRQDIIVVEQKPGEEGTVHLMEEGGGVVRTGTRYNLQRS